MPTLATLRANLLATALGLLAAILLVITVVQTVRIEGLGIWPLKIPGLQDKYDTAILKVVEARRELDRISIAKNEQAKRAEGNIEKAERGNREADKQAERIEKAPLPGNCETPPEILGADL